MVLYSQRDTNWSGLPLGNSGCLCGGYGCTVCSVAQALTLAGWNVTPKILIDGLNQNGGFDTEGYLKWYYVAKLFPQFHFYANPSQGAYKFNEGQIGSYSHWVLSYGGTYYDPLTGSTNLALSGVHNLKAEFSADIDANPNPPAIAVKIATASATVAPAAAIVRIDSKLGRAVHIGEASTSAPTADSKFLHYGDQVEVSGSLHKENLYPNESIGTDLWYVSHQSVLDNAKDSTVPLRYFWGGETTVVKNLQTA